ncbi:MAG: hypothetical protein GF350_08345 [Chitinivibrionales bacterium]|nr:hypothetical protein [Chitinivibrionales bacterium]
MQFGDSTLEAGYYELVWESPATNRNWEIFCYLKIPEYYSKGGVAPDIQKLADYIIFQDTCKKILSQQGVTVLDTLSSNNAGDYNGYQFITDLNNRIRYILPYRKNMSYANYDSSMDYLINEKEHQWDLREYKIVLIEPIQVISP